MQTTLEEPLGRDASKAFVGIPALVVTSLSVGGACMAAILLHARSQGYAGDPGVDWPPLSMLILVSLAVAGALVAAGNARAAITRMEIMHRREKQRESRVLVGNMGDLDTLLEDLQAAVLKLNLRCKESAESIPKHAMEADAADMHAAVEALRARVHGLRGTGERARRIDVDEVLQQVAGDYRRAGHVVVLEASVGTPIEVCGEGLRRIVENVLDCLVGQGRIVHISAGCDADHLEISMCDRTGILDSAQDASGSVGQPEPRLCLGLRVASRLALALGGDLQLQAVGHARLTARVCLPRRNS